jgi:hypothetical protein
MARSQVTSRVHRPASLVFERIASHAWTNEPAWEPEVLGVKPDAGGLRVGGRVAMTRRDFGKVRTTTYEITALEPQRRIAIRHVDGPLDFALEFVVAPVSRTESGVTVTVDVNPRGPMRVLTPMFALMGPRQNARISRDMVDALETAIAPSDAGDQVLAAV